MRLSDLRGKRVRTLDGESLGRVHDVRADKGKIVALICGPAGFIERWTAGRGGRRIAWTNVKRVDDNAIVIVGEAGKRKRR